MWKRMALSIAVLAAVVFFVGGATLALFTSSTGNVSTTRTSGTVTLSTPAHTLVDVSPMAPGDEDTQSYSVQYTGNLSAWLGLVYTASGDLTTCDGGGRFTVAVKDSDGTTYPSNTLPQVILGAGGAAAPAGQNATKRFSIRFSLDETAGNGCQDKTAQINVQVVAVQAGHNTNAAGNGPITWGYANPPDSACAPTGGYLDSKSACPVAASPIVGTVTKFLGYYEDGSTWSAVPADAARWYKLHLTPGNYQFSLAAQGRRYMAIRQGPDEWPVMRHVWSNQTAQITVSTESDYYLLVIGNEDAGPFTVTWGKV